MKCQEVKYFVARKLAKSAYSHNRTLSYIFFICKEFVQRKYSRIDHLRAVLLVQFSPVITEDMQIPPPLPEVVILTQEMRNMVRK